jgi:DNA-binding XRE family transcriptional regulator
MRINNLKTYRKLEGYTQKQMAEALGISEASYNRKENNKIDISIKEINIILEKFDNITYDDLFRNSVIKYDTKGGGL